MNPTPDMLAERKNAHRIFTRLRNFHAEIGASCLALCTETPNGDIAFLGGCLLLGVALYEYSRRYEEREINTLTLELALHELSLAPTVKPELATVGSG